MSGYLRDELRNNPWYKMKLEEQMRQTEKKWAAIEEKSKDRRDRMAATQSLLRIQSCLKYEGNTPKLKDFLRQFSDSYYSARESSPSLTRSQHLSSFIQEITGDPMFASDLGFDKISSLADILRD